MRVCVLGIEGANGLGMVGPRDFFWRAGMMHQQIAGLPKPFFDVYFAGLRKGRITASGGYQLICEESIYSVKECDILVLPILDGNLEAILPKLQPFLAPIRRLHRRGSEVISICTGAFLLAETGLLDGKSATTHWCEADRFRKRYPRVALQAEALFVAQGELMSSAGATSFLNLLLSVVDRHCGPQTAEIVGRFFLIDTDKPFQGTYALPSLVAQPAKDPIIERAIQFARQRQGIGVKVEDMAEHVGVNLRTFIRHFKADQCRSPVDFLMELRLTSVKDALVRTSDVVEEIAAQAGYQDITYFRRFFREQTGLSPTAYRTKYAPGLAAAQHP